MKLLFDTAVGSDRAMQQLMVTKREVRSKVRKSNKVEISFKQKLSWYLYSVWHEEPCDFFYYFFLMCCYSRDKCNNYLKYF